MAGFTESSITLDFSTDNWFRFEKSLPYNKISGAHFKEMDACWVKDMGMPNAEFYAIELKDYSAGKLEDTSLFQALKDECMLRLKGYSSVWDGIEIHVLSKAAAQKHYGDFVK